MPDYAFESLHLELAGCPQADLDSKKALAGKLAGPIIG
jgi:hypothetical protein